MIRIISGLYRGRKVITPGHTTMRPTMTLIREAIFSMLLSRISLDNTVVLDVFCGSGSLSFEAMSRGAQHAFMIDSNSQYLHMIYKTAMNFGIVNKITCIHCNVKRLAKAYTKCDIVFIDPPYNSGLVELTLSNLYYSEWLKHNVLIILEISRDERFRQNIKFHLIEERVYGIAKILLLTRTR